VTDHEEEKKKSIERKSSQPVTGSWSQLGQLGSHYESKRDEGEPQPETTKERKLEVNLRRKPLPSWKKHKLIQNQDS